MNRLAPGNAAPLGATSDGIGVNFALFSANAERVMLCLFGEDGRETERVLLPARTGDIWHGYLPGAAPGLRYGYRVLGPYNPDQGLCFNHNKLLIDPYARALTGPVQWNEANFGYRFESGDVHTFDGRDNAAFIPKGIVTAPDRPQSPLNKPWTETILYELHVKGFTWRHPEVPAADRGKVKGLAAPAVLEYLRALGITAIELLPIFPFADETHLARAGLTNYWGYNPYNFFALDPRYGARNELAAITAVFHDAGIEVILDVVFNHTAEGDALGPTLSLRGIDDRSYHWRNSDGGYADYTGCGNTLNVTHPQVQQLVVDSLSAWAALGIDGFRFDLASVLGRGPKGFDADSPLLTAVKNAPTLRQCKLIAEPWDIGGYFLGQFPSGWAQWNDKFRDTMRRFWRGSGIDFGEVATRVAGSSDLFHAPTAGVNFITSHDGFTLEDVVSYAQKHNDDNGEHNRDGMSENFSSNWGVEGPTQHADVLAARAKAKRNLLASLCLAQGVPMLLAGDEIGHSQNGNNNAYCQDNATSWIEWAKADAALLADVRKLLAFRKAHPELRRETLFTGKPISDGPKDIAWLRPDGGEIAPDAWHELTAFGFLIAGTLLVIMNPGAPIAFHLPEGQWQIFMDTARDDCPIATGAYVLADHTLVILERA